MPEPAQQVNWQQLYVITEDWQSDLQFFDDEINFFKNLMSKYILSLLDDIEKTKNITGGLSDLTTRQKKLSQRINLHRRHLSDHFSSPFVLADPAYLDEHHLLENEMSAFVKKFRSTKRVVFRYLEKILKSEKSHHLISNS